MSTGGGQFLYPLRGSFFPTFREGYKIKLDEEINTYPKVSVIIPTFNRQETIKKAVLSVLEQSYKNLELIVVDDCSTDGTLKELDSINDDRLKIKQLESNKGACFARNYGVSISVGELISFQDSDDTWRSNFLSCMVDELIENNCDVVFCKLARHGYRTDLSEYPKLQRGYVAYKTLLKESIVSTQTLLGKSECFKLNPFDNQMPRLQDFDLVIRLGLSYKLFHVDKVLVDVYLQDDSLTNNYSKNVTALEMLLSKYSETWDKYPHLKAKYIDILATSYLKTGKIKADIFLDALNTQPTLMRIIKYVFFKITPSFIAKRLAMLIYKWKKNV